VETNLNGCPRFGVEIRTSFYQRREVAAATDITIFHRSLLILAAGRDEKSRLRVNQTNLRQQRNAPDASAKHIKRATCNQNVKIETSG
jgi:hypothetical protein